MEVLTALTQSRLWPRANRVAGERFVSQGPKTNTPCTAQKLQSAPRADSPGP